jgi:hypothetical protein
VIGSDLADTYTRPALECSDQYLVEKKNSMIFTKFSSKRCSAIFRSFSVILLVTHFKVKLNPTFKYTDVLNKVHIINLNDSVQQNIPSPHQIWFFLRFSMKKKCLKIGF